MVIKDPAYVCRHGNIVAPYQPCPACQREYRRWREKQPQCKHCGMLEEDFMHEVDLYRRGILRTYPACIGGPCDHEFIVPQS